MLPLGLVAIGVASAMLSALEFGWIDTSEAGVVGVVALGFAFPLALAASIAAFAARDAAAGTGLGVFAGVWLTTGLELVVGGRGPSAALGIFLLLGALALALVLPAAGSTRPLVGAVFAGGNARLLITGMYYIVGTKRARARRRRDRAAVRRARVRLRALAAARFAGRRTVEVRVTSARGKRADIRAAQFCSASGRAQPTTS